MKTVQRSAIVPYSDEQMFRLVDDIDNYPEFLPFCDAAEEMERTDDAVTASLSVAKGGFSKSFSTRNELNFPRTIVMNLVTGPLKHLRGQWLFTPLDEGACKIDLTIEYEFASLLTSMAFGAIFNELAESFVDAFSERAKTVYG